jgi:hypothetical protein
MSEEPDRITRRFLTPPVHQVHAHLRERMEAMGMTCAWTRRAIFAGSVATCRRKQQAAGDGLAHRHRSGRGRL